ncbi:MAG: porin [Marinobacter sp.]|nr:porin [Marinobacter sp.]
MKKQLLALAVGSLVVLPTAALADKGPTVYGKVNLSLEHIDDSTADNQTWKLQSNASRLGVKGALDLDVDQLKAIYQAEFQIAVDDGDNKGQTFSQRNIYGGFKHDTLGTLIAGKFDSPMKKSTGGVEQFGDLGGDLSQIFAGDERLSNIIQYSTPTLANAVKINVAVIPGEQTANPNPDNGLADAVSSSVVFENDMFYGALAYDSKVNTTLLDRGGKGMTDSIRGAAMAKISNFEVGALVEQAEDSDNSDLKDNSYLISGAVTLDRLKLKAQYGIADTSNTNNTYKLAAIGADYKLAKHSKSYIYFSQLKNDNSGDDINTFGVGFEHKFSM